MANNERMLAIDVLRGMTIFFMIIVNTPGSWSYVWSPLLHAPWHGCAPPDLVFPSFLFVIGLSMAFSLGPRRATTQKELVQKIIKRSLLIFLTGLMMNWFPFYYKHFNDLRIFGVLQRIAMAYLVAGLCVTFFKRNSALLIAGVVMLVLHWALLVYFGTGDPFSLEGNISGPIDIALLGTSHVYKGFGIPFEPEGLLGTLSSAAHILIGFLISRVWIVGKSIDPTMLQKILLASVIMLVSGWLLGAVYPISKPLWTGSYVLYTSGIIGLLLTFLIWLIDIKQLDQWTLPFKVFGFNSLISFVASVLFVKILFRISIGELNGYGWAYKTLYQPVFGNYLGSFLFALSMVIVVWIPAYWLYKKRIAIKL